MLSYLNGAHLCIRLQAAVGAVRIQQADDAEPQPDRASIRTLLDEINRTDCKVHVDVAKELQVSGPSRTASTHVRAAMST